jgi:ketosteroid isomerase-like protein
MSEGTEDILLRNLINDLEPQSGLMAGSAATSRSADEAAIRALYQQLMDGWNSGSGEAFAAPFAEDGDLVGFDGTHLKGRQEIASFHQQLFDTYVKGSRLVGKVRSVRFLTLTSP